MSSLLEEVPGTRSHNADYWYCGSQGIKPSAASDDGVHTRLRFAATAERPAIFVLNNDGSESLINFSMDGDDVVEHRLGSSADRPPGRARGQIVDESFSGSGERLESRTIWPRVKRIGEGRP